MNKPITFTSTLPEKIIQELNYYSELLNTKKNKIIEQALIKYFEESILHNPAHQMYALKYIY